MSEAQQRKRDALLAVGRLELRLELRLALERSIHRRLGRAMPILLPLAAARSPTDAMRHGDGSDTLITLRSAPPPGDSRAFAQSGRCWLGCAVL